MPKSSYSFGAATGKDAYVGGKTYDYDKEWRGMGIDIAPSPQNLPRPTLSQRVKYHWPMSKNVETAPWIDPAWVVLPNVMKKRNLQPKVKTKKSNRLDDNLGKLRKQGSIVYKGS